MASHPYRTPPRLFELQVDEGFSTTQTESSPSLKEQFQDRELLTIALNTFGLSCPLTDNLEDNNEMVISLQVGAFGIGCFIGWTTELMCGMIGMHLRHQGYLDHGLDYEKHLLARW